MVIPEKRLDIPFPTGMDGNDSVGVEAAVGPHRELSPGRRAGSGHRLTQEVKRRRAVLAQLALFARYGTITHFIAGAGGNGQHAGTG